AEQGGGGDRLRAESAVVDRKRQEHPGRRTQHQLADGGPTLPARRILEESENLRRFSWPLHQENLAWRGEPAGLVDAPNRRLRGPRVEVRVASESIAPVPETACRSTGVHAQRSVGYRPRRRPRLILPLPDDPVGAGRNGERRVLFVTQLH